MQKLTDIVTASSYVVQRMGKGYAEFYSQKISVAVEVMLDHVSISNPVKIEIVGLGKKTVQVLTKENIIRVDYLHFNSGSLLEDIAWALLEIEGDKSKNPVEDALYLSLELDHDPRYDGIYN
jgi:hypothetical protein